jgi:hypothetical protein
MSNWPIFVCSLQSNKDEGDILVEGYSYGRMVLLVKVKAGFLT